MKGHASGIEQGGGLGIQLDALDFFVSVVFDPLDRFLFFFLGVPPDGSAGLGEAPASESPLSQGKPFLVPGEKAKGRALCPALTSGRCGLIVCFLVAAAGTQPLFVVRRVEGLVRPQVEPAPLILLPKSPVGRARPPPASGRSHAGRPGGPGQGGVTCRARSPGDVGPVPPWAIFDSETTPAGSPRSGRTGTGLPGPRP